MSEYSTLYNFLKNDNTETVYIFHTGNFFNFVNEKVLNV